MVARDDTVATLVQWSRRYARTQPFLAVASEQVHRVVPVVLHQLDGPVRIVLTRRMQPQDFVPVA